MFKPTVKDDSHPEIVVLEATCINCKTTHEQDVDREGYNEWLTGRVFIQTAMPKLRPELRELFFISGICPKCWDDLFGEDED